MLKRVLKEDTDRVVNAEEMATVFLNELIFAMVGP